jgi:hypothetical protein
MLPLYQDDWFTFRFAEARIIPRFHLEGVEAGRGVSVVMIDPGTGERLKLLATATVGEEGWVDLTEPIIMKAGEAFIALLESAFVICKQIPPTLNWLEPWEPLKDSGESFVDELRKELPSRHVLFDVPVRAIARHVARDDVLFATTDSENPLAVVHLTWAGRSESDPQWPHTTLYTSWQDWIERRLNPDHREYSGAGQTEGGQQ